jgi:hypothetical protein
MFSTKNLIFYNNGYEIKELQSKPMGLSCAISNTHQTLILLQFKTN